MNSWLSEKIKIKSPNINILRFICAIAVIICHSYAVTAGEEDFVSRYTGGQCNLGGVAVAVFFFLSGLYVSKSLDRTDSAWTFMKKRCDRIFPSLWAVVILSVILGAAISTLPLGKYLTDKGTYLYLLNGALIPIHDLPGVFEGQPYRTVNGPLWTMPVEFACYIGLAVIMLLSGWIIKDKKNRKRFEIAAAAVLFVVFIYAQYKMPESMAVSVARAMVIFFEGVLYYEYREKIRLNPAAAAAALAAVILLGFTPVFNIGLILLFPYAVTGLALGLPQAKRDLKLFSVSYEMYLVGWPIQQAVMKYGGKMSPAANWLITLPIDILIGWAVYKAVELMTAKINQRKGKAEGR